MTLQGAQPSRAGQGRAKGPKGKKETVVKTRLRYQSERVAGSSHKRRVMKTRLRAPAEPSQRHLPRQKPYQKHPRSLHHGICQDKNLTRTTRRAFATAFAKSPKTLGGRAYTKGRSPSGRSLNGISCVGGLTDTKSGTPNIHIKHSAAEGILTPEGAQASRATGFDP